MTRTSEALRWVAPRERDRLWWYSRGVELGADALDALSTAAELVCRFPEARVELDRLVEVELGLAATLARPNDLTTLVAGETIATLENAADPSKQLEVAVATVQGGGEGEGRQ